MSSDDTTVVVNGKNYPLSHEGRLQNSQDWSEEVAAALANNSDIELTQDHWVIINCLRKFHLDYNHTPVIKLLLKAVKKKDENLANEASMLALFPGDVLHQATIIAGIPNTNEHLELNTDGKENSSEEKPSPKKQAENPPDEFEFESKIYHLSKEGNLIEHDAWTEQMADFLAKKEGIELSDDHWLVLRFMRGFYQEFKITPMVKLLIKHMKGTLDTNKCNRDYLNQLFPDGPSKQGSRIAGLPYPVGCID